MKPTNDGECFDKGEFLLKNWCFRYFGDENNNLDGFWMVDGRVFNNPKFRDGMFIHTSDVMSIKVLDDRLKVETSNSIYTCMFKDSKEEFYDFLKASDLFDMSANIFDISMLKQKIEEAKEIEKEKQNEYIRKLVKTDALIIFFSDQDDVWLCDKAKVQLQAMNNKADSNNTRAVGVFTDSIVVDENLNIISDSFLNYQGIDVKIVSDDSIYYKNCIQG